MTFDNVGNILATATKINLTSTKQTFGDFVGTTGSNDFYSFNLNSRSSLNLNLHRLTADADVRIVRDINSNGIIDGSNEIIASSDPNQSWHKSIKSILDAGNYFIQVFSKPGANTDYALSINSTAVSLDFAGNTLTTARQIAVGSTRTTFTDWVGSTDTNDYYRLSINQNSRLNVAFTSLSSNINIQLLDINGSTIASASNIDFIDEVIGAIGNQVSAGTYFIRVSPTNGVNTNYDLSVAATPQDFAGNSINTARQINVGTTATTFTDWVGVADTDDFYRFTLNQNSNFNLSLSGLSGDADVRLLDGTGNFIASSTAFGASNEFINRQLNAGNYFIRVFPVTGVETNYNLNLAATPITPPDLAGNTPATARQISVGPTVNTFTDWVGAADTNDFYRFTLNQDANFSLSLHGLSGNADVQLLDSAGNFIAVSAASNITNDSINRQLNAASYFIRVFPAVGASTNYNLAVVAIPRDFAGNTLGTARQINVASTTTTFTDWVGSADTDDYYRFTLNQNSNINLSLNSLSDNADVQLLDGATNLVIASSAVSGISNEFINRQLNAGNYFIRVFPATGANTNYNLSIAATPIIPPDFAGNTLGTARQISLGSTTTTFTDWVGRSDIYDYYRFSVDRNSNLNFSLNGLSGSAYFTLLDSNNNTITSSTNFGNINNSINRQVSAGTYFIRVTPMADVDTNYNLNVAATPVIPTDFAGNTLGTARQISVGSTTTTFADWVGAADTDDYYRFTINQNSNFNLSLSGLSGNADVQLLDGATNLVIANSATSGISNEFINRQLNAGNYFIRVFPAAGANTNYNLNVAATPIIPQDFAGNTIGTARQITVGSTTTTFTDWVGTADTNDFYRFTLNQNSNFNLSLNGLSSNADVQLLDGSGNFIASSTASGLSNEFINRQLNAGNYFIRVFPATGANTNYNLSVTATANSTSFIDRVLELVNTERRNAGLSNLRLNSQLNQAAQGHSEEMAIRDYYSHTGYNGSRFSDRILATGYKYSAAAENIAVGYTTPEDVVKGWMNSDGHRRNILNAAYSEIGIGYYFLNNDTGAVNYNHYWTQNFGTPQ